MEFSSPSWPAKYVSNTFEASTTRAFSSTRACFFSASYCRQASSVETPTTSVRMTRAPAPSRRRNWDDAPPSAASRPPFPSSRGSSSADAISPPSPGSRSRGAAIRSAADRSCSTGTSCGSSVIANTRCATALGDATTAVPPRASTDLTARMSALMPLESMNVIPETSITTCDRPPPSRSAIRTENSSTLTTSSSPTSSTRAVPSTGNEISIDSG